MREGHGKLEAKKMIGCVVVAEMFEVVRHGRDNDHNRYLAALAGLPRIRE